MQKKIEQYQTGWDFIEDWLDEPMTPLVIYILDSRRYAYLTSNTPSRSFKFGIRRKLTHVDDVEAFAYWSHNNSLAGGYSFESTRYDQSYLSALAYGYLSDDINQFSEVDAFKDWYVEDGLCTMKSKLNFLIRMVLLKTAEEEFEKML